MKRLTWFLLALLTVAPLGAKPKVDVRVKVNDSYVSNRPTEAFRTGAIYTDVWYFNVTVLSDNAQAVAQNNGQWCLSGDTRIEIGSEYQGTLDGNSIDIQVPDKNGKTKKLHFEIKDHKWRKLAEIND